MKKTLFAVITFIFLIMSEYSCKKDNKSSLVYNMNFTLSAGTVPLLLGPGNVAVAPLRYYLNQLQYYIGFPRLEKSDGTEVPLSNLFLVEYNTFPLAAPNAVYGTNFSFQIPAGSYTGIKFGIGVPAKILDTIKHWHYYYNNKLDALDQDYGMPWTMTDSIRNEFRDIELDVLVDTSVTQNQAVNRDYTFHIINDRDTANLYYEMVLSDVFAITNGDSHSVTINLDFSNVFFNKANPINFRNIVGTDDMFNYDIPGIQLGESINRNIHNSLTLKQN